MNEEIELFNNYYHSFKEDNPMYKSKYDHTFRVVGYAKLISKMLNLNNLDTNKALICALFHDIGRFNEAKLYNDFSYKKFDHGDEGYKVLKELNYNDNIVLLSTKYHNKYSLPDNLDSKTKMFCEITRDTDKLDIMATQCLVIDKNDQINKEIIKDILNGKLVSSQNIHNKTDALLRCISFIFDINFEESFKILLDNKIIENKLKILKDNNDDKMVNKIVSFINKYLEERLNKC